jgi:amidase
MTIPVTSWEERAAEFKAELAAKIPPKWVIEQRSSTNVSYITATSGLLDARELEIIQHDASALAKAIARKAYTATEVAVAYAKAGAVVQQATNCVMDFDLETALERAKWLDAELERTGKPVGPFHGVPISIKGW